MTGPASPELPPGSAPGRARPGHGGAGPRDETTAAPPATGADDPSANRAPVAPPEPDERPDPPAYAHRYALLAGGIVAVIVAAVIGSMVAWTGAQERKESHMQTLISEFFPGEEWVCRDSRPSEQGVEYRLRVTPGINITTPTGPIKGAPPVDSRYHAQRDTEYMHFGAWTVDGNKITFAWHAAWTDPATMREMALAAKENYPTDAAGTVIDPRQRDDLDNLSRGILLLDTITARDVILVSRISGSRLSGTIQSTVSKTNEPAVPQAPQPIECNRPAATDAPPADLEAARTPSQPDSVATPPGTASNDGSRFASNSIPLPPQRPEPVPPTMAEPVPPQVNAPVTAPVNSPAAGAGNPDALPPADASADPATLTEQEARAFVAQWFSASSVAATPADVLRFYAPQVDYYKRGFVSKSYVEKDKQLYFRQWPVRRSRIEGPVGVFPGNKPNVRVAIFRLSYEVEDNARRMKRGTARVRLLLSKRPGGIVIGGEGN